jgi:drug/metabolite transporter (DMT)-like permease
MATTRQQTPAVSELRRPGPAAFGMLFLVGFTFGLMFVFNRLATTHGVPFIPYVFLQSLGGALILLALCGARNQMPGLSAKTLKFYFLAAVFNFSIPFSILSLVAPKVPSGILSLGLMLIPLMIYALALALGMDRFHWIRLAGLLLGLGGVLLVLLPKTSLPSPDLAGWVAFGMLAPVSYAVGTILMAWLQPAATKSLPLACGLLIASAITMVPVMAVAGSWWFFDGPLGIGHWAVVGAIVNTAAIYVLVFEILKRAGPVFFSTSNYIATLLGVGIGMFFFGDSHSLWIWAALLLMFVGLFCVNSTGSSQHQEK